MSENLRIYTKTLYVMDAVVRRVPAGAWDNPSPCADWTAREVLGHAIWGLRSLTAAITGATAPEQQAEADVAGDDPVASWTGAMDAMLCALDQRGSLRRIIATPFGQMQVNDAIGALFIDPLAHAFDIATACGIEPALPEELATRGLAVLEPLNGSLRRPGLFGDRVEIDDGSTVDRFIAFTGRQP
jgi:uncharacterized protein (TIGR03086 family)